MFELNSIIWDNHACMPLRAGDTKFLEELKNVKASGVHIITLNVSCASPDFTSAVSVSETFTDWIGTRSDEYLLVRTAEDAEEARQTGKLGICFDIEGADVLEGDVSRVRIFYNLGVRWMLPTYNKANALGGGCMENRDKGLTDFGKLVVREMNDVGMVVCASHCGYKTARELIDISRDPVIFSHSNPAGVWQHPRNIPDKLILACAERGGVIGINGFGGFLGENDASSECYAAHLDYTVNLVGPDHVGIALDFIFDRSEFEEFLRDNPHLFPSSLFGKSFAMVEHAQLPEVYAILSRKGYSKDDLAKIFGGNHLRVAKQVWKKP